MSSKVEWPIELKGNKTTFTVIIHMRVDYLLKKHFKKGMKNAINTHNRHVAEE